MSDFLDRPPEHAADHVRLVGKRPHCSACGKPVGAKDQWRCPYLACRSWLRGTGDVLDEALRPDKDKNPT